MADVASNMSGTAGDTMYHCVAQRLLRDIRLFTPFAAALGTVPTWKGGGAVQCGSSEVMKRPAAELRLQTTTCKKCNQEITIDGSRGRWQKTSAMRVLAGERCGAYLRTFWREFLIMTFYV